MTSCEQPAISVSSPAELVEAVPYLLGFHPDESLVALGFRRRSGGVGPPTQIAVTARTDLDPADPSGLDLPSAAAMLQVLEDAGCAAVAAVLFSNRARSGDPRSDPQFTRIALTLSELLESAEIAMLDVLLATNTHWWSLCCEHPECCPPTGTPRLEQSALAAEFTYAGLVAHPSRASLLATLDGRPEGERTRLLPALHRADQRLVALLERKGAQTARRTELAALMRAAYDCRNGQVLSDRRLVRLGAALRDIDIRDELWLAVDSRAVTPIGLLEQLHSRLPAPYDAGPMFLYGWASWRGGSGTVAVDAAERALRSDPAYSAAQLLLEAVQTGLDPHDTPNLLGSSG